jgi:hypothetical protein
MIAVNPADKVRVRPLVTNRLRVAVKPTDKG